MRRPGDRPSIRTIPSSDSAFREHVERLASRHPFESPHELAERLRRIFPRVIVRPRDLAGEPPAWYVYRDGAWRTDTMGPWWTDDNVPQLIISPEGWIEGATATARSLLGIGAEDSDPRHVMDFIAPRSTEDADELFGLVVDGHELTGTVLIRPSHSEVIACDVHAERVGETIRVALRLADDQSFPSTPPRPDIDLVTYPSSDVVFGEYARLALARMSEPTADGLGLRLRRLYPHAQVHAQTRPWVVFRDGSRVSESADGWWLDDTLPRLRYDTEALIIEANAAAERFFGRAVVGHHWQEFVTPGSTEQVKPVLDVIREAGIAISRFRMPRADGALIEFDSFTEFDGDTFTTVMRPEGSSTH